MIISLTFVVREKWSLYGALRS